MEALVRLLHAVARSTVTISASIPPQHPSATVLGSTRSGTGSVIDDAGHVLTVNYVVLGATDVSIADFEGRRGPAEVVAQDFATGVAVVRARYPLDVAPLAAGDSRTAVVGEPVFIVASAAPGEPRSSSGAISSLEPFDAYWEYRLDRALWATCTNPGLGGGAVCSRSGALLGIVSLNLGTLGRATLAVPAENYFDHCEELLTHGRRISRPRRSWLGMFCYAFPDRTVVAGLVPGAPAERWGLEVGDVIARVDRHAVQTRADLYECIWAREPGDVVELEVYRDGEAVSVQVHSTDVEEFFR